MFTLYWPTENGSNTGTPLMNSTTRVQSKDQMLALCNRNFVSVTKLFRAPTPSQSVLIGWFENTEFY
jgi:hypothetical protein